MSSLTSIIDKFSEQRILVIGDVMLDHYIWGDVERISPEAPVPVVKVTSEEYRLGGAANTVANICSLSAQASIVGVVGRDRSSNALSEKFCDLDMYTNLVFDDDRQTTVKRRIIAHGQQVVRVDHEDTEDLEVCQKNDIVEYAVALTPRANAIIISDYDKGVISKSVLDCVFACAKEHDKPVIVDPKLRHFWDYEGATAITPNLAEASAALRTTITQSNLERAGRDILRGLELEALLITRAEDGMSLFCGAGQASSDHIPTIAKEVYDVTGAGDTVVAVFTLARAAGASWLQAAELANCAAGIVVSKVGARCVTKEELNDSTTLSCLEKLAKESGDNKQ